MTSAATHVLEEFRRLAPAEKREVIATLAEEVAVAVPSSLQPKQSPANRIRLDPVLANEIALSDACNPEEA